MSYVFLSCLSLQIVFLCNYCISFPLVFSRLTYLFSCLKCYHLILHRPLGLDSLDSKATEDVFLVDDDISFQPIHYLYIYPCANPIMGRDELITVCRGTGSGEGEV